MINETIKRRIAEWLPYRAVKKKLEFSPQLGQLAKESPQLYNMYGEPMKMFFLKDKGCAHIPYTLSAGRFPRNIVWDRFNYALPIHFYTHSDIFDKLYEAEKRFALLRESETILPKDFERVLKQPEIVRDFDVVFTHSTRILNKYENAKFIPASSVWYATELNGGVMDALNYQKKKKNISIISSNKIMCKMHKFRIELAKKYMRDERVDTYGAACGNYIEKKATALTDYRYSIVIENDITEFYFTEKIMDCFAAMTVPIYIGAKRIGDFFNTDGIIQVMPDEYEHLDDIIKNCCSSDYNERKEAIIDNFQRVQEYLCTEDYMMKHYGKLFE